MTFAPPPGFTTRPTLEGSFGMSASTHWLATASAQAVLERGGNAFDAVVAGGFVLHVVEPHLNGPGGDLVGLLTTAVDPRPVVLMGQGPAPAAATIGHYRARGLDLVPGAGALAAAVPGAVDAWLLLLRDHGTWELRDVLAYAEHYAREGHALGATASATIGRVAALFRDAWPTSAERWLVDGEPPAPGTIVRNREYADLLRALSHAGSHPEGPDSRAARIDAARAEWRRRVGATAPAFLARPHRHSDGGDHAGVLTSADIEGFDAGYERPVSRDFRGHTIVKAGAWTQGPALLQSLGILDGFSDDRLDPSTTAGAHAVIEAQKLAYADRDAWFGDADVDLDTLLSDAYLDERRRLILPEAADRWRPGALGGRTPLRPPLRTSYTPPGPASRSTSGAGATGEPTVSTSGVTNGDTCHIDVVDAWGNLVSVTPSGGWLQSSPTVPGLGFCLGTRLQMTWLEPGHASSLTPGRRPRTTLTPTLVLRGGRPAFAIGTPGGDQQDQWQLLALLRMIVGRWTPQAAIHAPAFHTTALLESFWPRTWNPRGVVVEDRAGADLVDGLRRRGHEVTEAGPWTLGRLSAVGRDLDRDILWAAANPRGQQGYAAGR